jgi:hypothetical protein
MTDSTVRDRLETVSGLLMDAARELDAAHLARRAAEASHAGQLRNTLAFKAEAHALRAVKTAARALIDDVRRRYPGEELRCPLMRALDEASLAALVEEPKT